MDDQLKQSALDFHEFPVPGKIRSFSDQASGNAARPALAYSPGVAAPCLEIEKDPLAAYKYTARGNWLRLFPTVQRCWVSATLAHWPANR